MNPDPLRTGLYQSRITSNLLPPGLLTPGIQQISVYRTTHLNTVWDKLTQFASGVALSLKITLSMSTMFIHALAQPKYNL